MHAAAPLDFLLGLGLAYAGRVLGITGGVIAVPILGRPFPTALSPARRRR